MQLRRQIDANTISFELKGKHSKKFKVEDSVHKSYIRALLDVKPGANRDGINRWKVLGESKIPEAVFYTHIAYYILFHGKTQADKLDKKHLITDTLLNFTITNNATLSRFAVHTLSSLAHNSQDFFQNVIFARLSLKMVEYDQSLENPEREKLSDLVIHPHKSRSINNLVKAVLKGNYLNNFNKLCERKQEMSLEPKGLIHYIIAVNSPTIYNFNEKGNIKHAKISEFLSNIKEHYSNHTIIFEEIIAKISEALVAKMATKLFMFSHREHMRKIAVNVCGSLSGINNKFYEIVSDTFKLNITIDQVKKCLKCKELFNEQCPRISFYDMNHISESAGALMKVFDNKLKTIEKNKKEAEKHVEEVKVKTEVKSNLKKGKDMNKFLLGGVGLPKKKGKKGGTKKKNTTVLKKDPPKVAKAAKTATEVDKPLVEENKEERTKRDLKTVKDFLEYTFAKSCCYIDSI